VSNHHCDNLHPLECIIHILRIAITVYCQKVLTISTIVMKKMKLLEKNLRRCISLMLSIIELACLFYHLVPWSIEID